ncbi:hypothetical protein UlMin_043023 [Ulmus minor]
MDDEKKKEVLKKAYNTLILNRSDKVLREIMKCKSVADVWLKLESLYMTKNLSNRLHLKAKFFTLKMKAGRDLQIHIDDFNKLTMDLDNIGVEYEDEDKALRWFSSTFSTTIMVRVGNPSSINHGNGGPGNGGPKNGGPGNRGPENEETEGNDSEGEGSEREMEQPRGVLRPEPLYKRFSNMKPAEFEGSTNPLDAEEWISSIQTIMEFMELNDRERVFCASYMLKKEARYWWESVKARRDVQLMTWAEFVEEFNRKPDISLAIESGGDQPKTTSDCIERAFRAEHRLNQLKEMKAKTFEAKKKQWE